MMRQHGERSGMREHLNAMHKTMEQMRMYPPEMHLPQDVFPSLQMYQPEKYKAEEGDKVILKEATLQQ